MQLLLLAIGVVAVWRGVWGLMDLYIFPNDLIMSFTASIIIGVVLLLLNDRKLDELF